MLKAAIVTLGCPKNQVDSEMIKGLLLENGYGFEENPAMADIIVVNTCGFIEDAKQESINTLIEMGRYKKRGRCRLVVATGCLAQRYGKDLLREMPEVDVMMGTTSFPDIVGAINRSLKGEKVLNVKHSNLLLPEGLPRSGMGKGRYAYLQIAEGCDNRCSYCVIPGLRGSYRSRSEENIIN